MNINNLTLIELYELNKKVVARIKSLRDKESRQIANKLTVGDIVSFVNKCNIKVNGTITKINKKTANVTVDGTPWRVALSLLTQEMSVSSLEAMRQKLLNEIKGS